MRLTELLEEDGIIADLKAKNKIGVLEELVEALKKLHPSVDKNALVKVLLERERLGSTGIGDGVAIPHGKFHAINHPVISFGRSRKGLDYESVDGEPAYLFFLLVAPENSASVHLKALAKIATSTAYLTTFRYKGDRLEVDGIAANASELIAVLERSPYFKNVEFTAPTTKYLQNQERFSLRMGLDR